MLHLALPIPRVGYPRAWVKAAEKQLKGKKVESLETMTAEGIKLKPLYGAADLESCSALADPEHDAPGLFPYHRWARILCLTFAPSDKSAGLAWQHMYGRHVGFDPMCRE